MVEVKHRKTKPQSKVKLALTVALSVVLLLLGTVSLGSAIWYVKVFGLTGFDSILFTLSAGLNSVQTGLIDSYLKNALLPSLLAVAVIETLVLLLRKTAVKRRKNLFTSITSLVLSLALIVSGGICVKLDKFIIDSFSSETVFKDNYVSPSSKNIIFPENKRNLIYIYLESMETTYLSKELGGDNINNLIPELTSLAKSNINFSNNNTVGGARCTAGSTWTVAAMVAQSAGIPLKLPLSIDGNSYGQYDKFLPGAKTINNVLHDNGYEQAIIFGSDADFGGRKQYFIQHGVDRVYDWKTAQTDGIIPKDYFVWWGMEDLHLFDYAKKAITELAAGDKPFAVTMLTADTHHIGGCDCEKCKNIYPEHYENVIACSSRQVASFIKWIKKQPFYENTTIVLCGDHCSMDNDYASRNIDENYTRRVYNCIINPAVTPVNAKNREFTTLDMFPTTLAAMGCEIKGNRLGLGVNLFSSEKTLAEKMGYEELDGELAKYSSYYDSHFIKE